MRLITRIVFAVAVINSTVNAQFFYDATRDQTAQQAEATARQIAAGTLFEKELRNADSLSRLQIAGRISIARKAYLSTLDSLETWEEVSKHIAGIKTALGAQPQLTKAQREARLKEIIEKQGKLKISIAALKTKEHTGTLIETILDRLDQGESLVTFAKGLVGSENKNASAAFGHIETALAVAKSLFDVWKSTFGGIPAIKADLAELAIPPEVLH